MDNNSPEENRRRRKLMLDKRKSDNKLTPSKRGRTSPASGVEKVISKVSSSPYQQRVSETSSSPDQQRVSETSSSPDQHRVSGTSSSLYQQRVSGTSSSPYQQRVIVTSSSPYQQRVSGTSSSKKNINSRWNEFSSACGVENVITNPTSSPYIHRSNGTSLSNKNNIPRMVKNSSGTNKHSNHGVKLEACKQRNIVLDSQKSNVTFSSSVSNINPPFIPDATNTIARFQSAGPNTTPLSNITNVMHNGTSPKERRRQRKLIMDRKRSARNSSSASSIFVEQSNNVDDIYSGVSKDYNDHGDQSIICELCNAKLWKGEKASYTRDKDVNSYFLCCAYGKVLLPEFKQPRESYRVLFDGLDAKSKYFLKNICRFNSMFSFTSMGGKIDNSINRGNAPFVFRLGGQNYHNICSLLPNSGSKPKFSQLYIYDTQNEVNNRRDIFGPSTLRSHSTDDTLNTEIINFLKSMLDDENQLVKSYRMVRNCYEQNPHVELKLRLIGKREHDGRTYNLPTASEVAALIVGDITDAMDTRDIIVQHCSGELQLISELHPSYLALQYPLLLPYGDDGYRVDILHRGASSSSTIRRYRCTMREYFAYHVQDRVDKFSLIMNSRWLYQQFLVDVYTMIESERLYYIRNQQTVLRCHSYETLLNAQNQRNAEIRNTGRRVILPSSFTGGARYMMQNYLDAMSLCKWFGYPYFFITITCNPKWPEVRRFLKDTTLKPEDRPDILCRLFKIKLDQLIKDIREKSLFGTVSAVVYTVEFQKRGLPHAHICLFLHSKSKIVNVEQVDRFISAEIPDKDQDPELYSLVSDFMIHGPCGVHNIHCPCMVDKKCSKRFPKRFRDYTSTDDDGFPQYRRRDCESFVEKSGVKLDNRSVVPYNEHLLRRYQAHINVEWCNQAGSIKYLFKYINKGPDRATVSLCEEEEEVDEIKQYYDCRYISACEATWRIFSFDVHFRTPSVMRLPFHLPDQQQVIYGEDVDFDNVVDNASVASSMFLAWMECNEEYEEARQLCYIEFPTKFVWHLKERSWKPRKRGFQLGRITYISPACGEPYFLRVLLNKVKGPRSYEEIRTVDGICYDTFRDACYALGLLDDDREYIHAIEEAAHSGLGHYLRSLFATMLMTYSLSRPDHVWINTWKHLSDDILYRQRITLGAPDLHLLENQVQNLTLLEIERILLRNNSTLRKWTVMPYPQHESISAANNLLIIEEMAYNNEEMQVEFDNLSRGLTTEQKFVFDNIIQSVQNINGGVFFVYGYGGTGKTYLWKTLSVAIRREGHIVLNVASSGITSLLLTGGRTAHSRFAIPFDVNEDSICTITAGTDLSKLLIETKLIIWDEAPMMHKHAIEALDRTLRDVLNCEGNDCKDIPFGGKVVVFGGDFRQIIPVVANGTRQDIVNASLCSSYLWSSCKVLTLTKNMRLTVGNEASDNEETRQFARWLLDIGEGKVGGSNDGEADIEIPEDLLILNSPDPILDLINFVYPDLLSNFNIPGFFEQRSLLAPTNEVVREINDRLLELFPGEENVYLSSDSICREEYLNEMFDESLYTPDVLNGLKVSGLPNHKLALKVGVPVMLLRNIDQKNGLCNGTRLQIVALGNRVIEAKIISGINIGHRVFIPRLSLTPSDKKIPFRFQRRQFPVSICFAMAVTKSQGQSLSRVGLLLKEPVFTHGQLYVALSRVKSRGGLKLLILDKDNQVTNMTRNVVYKEVFSYL